MGKTITMNIKVKDYSSRVLGVVKEKYGLNDKGQALDKFAEMYGEEFVEPEAREDVVKEVIRSCDRHIKKYGFRKTSVEELDRLCRGE